MQLLSTDRTQAPAALLAELRRNRTTSAAQLKRTLDTWDLRPLTGGRNNDVYSWTGPHGLTCIKVYQVDERWRVQREWHALTLLARPASSSPGETPTW